MAELSTENPVFENLPVAGALSLLHMKGAQALTIAVDIDGTLAPNEIDESEYATLEPFPGAVETLKTLKKLGIKIVIWTARNSSWRSITEYWLSSKEIPYDELIMDKPSAQLYIDDKAFKFTTWSDVVERLLLPKS